MTEEKREEFNNILSEKWASNEEIINYIEAYKDDCVKEEVTKVLNDFAEFCHEKYLGATQNKKSKTGYEYSYEDEVIWMAEEYLNSKND